MRSCKIADLHYFLPLHLLLMNAFICTRSIEVSDKIFEGASSGNQFPVREETTTTTTASVVIKPVTEINEKLTAAVENPPRNGSDDFRPSVHLGEIEQSTIRTNPFNSVQHVNFGNSVRLGAQNERFQDIVRDTYQSVVPDESTQSSRIKFENDDADAVQATSARHPFGDQRVIVNQQTPFDEGSLKHAFVDHTSFFQNVDKPEAQVTSTDHRLAGTYFDASRSPYVVSYHSDNKQHAAAYQPITQDNAANYEIQPENGLLFLQQHESTYTRKRKFPYQFYQPTGAHHEIEFAEEPYHSTVAYPRNKKVLPWKKIIHLIGTFLPLGLLLATLTPNVVRINNTTKFRISQPNIVLSKLRAVDLPVEHKQARLLEDRPSAACEDRSICEMILAGGEPKSDVLQNILWNLAERISEDAAKKNGLREVLGAVRKKDCATISCLKFERIGL